MKKYIACILLYRRYCIAKKANDKINVIDLQYKCNTKKE